MSTNVYTARPSDPEVIALASRLLRTPEEVAEKINELGVLYEGGDPATVKPETVTLWKQLNGLSIEELEAESAKPLPWETGHRATA